MMMGYNVKRYFNTGRSYVKMALMKGISTWREARGGCPFSVVAIETTTHCNRRCVYCPVSVDPKQARAMPMELFQEIIGQLAAIGFRGRLTYHFYNEPLLNRNLEKLVACASQQLPNAKHVIYTSGDLLTPSRAEALFTAGVTSFVVTDHGGMDLTEPVRRAASAWLSVRTRIKFRRFTTDSSLFNRGGLVQVQNERNHTKYCAYPAYEMVIDVDGNVILCCNDYYANYKFGNVKESPLLSIWESPPMRQVRQRLLAGQFDLPICRTCVGLKPPSEPTLLMTLEARRATKS